MTVAAASAWLNYAAFCTDPAGRSRVEVDGAWWHGGSVVQVVPEKKLHEICRVINVWTVCLRI